MKAKTIRLLSLFLALGLFLGTASIAFTTEPPNTPDDPDVTFLSPVRDIAPSWAEGIVKPPSSDLTVSESVEPQSGPFSVPDVSIVPGRLNSLSATRSTADDWQIECVDCPKEFGSMTNPSMQLDSEGHPRIAYGNRGHLYYAWHNGTQWIYETVDELSPRWCNISLALDGADRPHISYDYSGDLKYAWHNGTEWHVETVDSAIYVTSPSLALDESDRPHISYYDGSHYDLKYAWHDGSAWRIETVDSEGIVGWYSSLALDGADRPHISYYYCGAYGDQGICDPGHLKYAWHNGSAWHIETVDSEGDAGRYSSLALDELGYPHISYYDGYLNYAWHNGSVWHIETVGSEGGAREISLALDRADRPHISYYSYSNNALNYAWHDGSDWHIEMVDSEGEMWNLSLLLDKARRPHIGYYYCGTRNDVFDSCDPGNLRYARHDGAAWHIEIVDSEAMSLS
ncbi:MAG: hypothetical protein GY832_19355 [Chloroflexi bacterium]|nr:hypothetical protein [Chloroflexota bacterium]